MPPSMKVAPVVDSSAAISRAVAGAIALASRKWPVNPYPAIWAATEAAAAGGQTEMMVSESSARAASVPWSTSASVSARCRVASLRPTDAHPTSWPFATRAAPRVVPMAPG